MQRLLPKQDANSVADAANSPGELNQPPPPIPTVGLPTFILVPVAPVSRHHHGHRRHRQVSETVPFQADAKKRHHESSVSGERTKLARRSQRVRKVSVVGDENSAEPNQCRRCVDVGDEPCVLHSLLISDTPTMARAYGSLPSQLYIAQKEGMLDPGVFAKRAIPHPSVFGPLLAPLTPHPVASFAVDHRFGLREKNGSRGENAGVLVFDLKSDDACNWIKFVHEAVDAEQQNLVAFQQDDRVYLATTKVIPAETELCFWYSTKYCQLLNKENLAPGLTTQENNDAYVDESLDVTANTHIRMDALCNATPTAASSEDSSVVQNALPTVDDDPSPPRSTPPRRRPAMTVDTAIRPYYLWSKTEERCLVDWFLDPDNCRQWKRAGRSSAEHCGTKINVASLITAYMVEKGCTSLEPVLIKRKVAALEGKALQPDTEKTSANVRRFREAYNAVNLDESVADDNNENSASATAADGRSRTQTKITADPLMEDDAPDLEVGFMPDGLPSEFNANQQRTWSEKDERLLRDWLDSPNNLTMWQCAGKSNPVSGVLQTKSEVARIVAAYLVGRGAREFPSQQIVTKITALLDSGSEQRRKKRRYRAWTAQEEALTIKWLEYPVNYRQWQRAGDTSVKGGSGVSKMEIARLVKALLIRECGESAREHLVLTVKAKMAALVKKYAFNDSAAEDLPLSADAWTGESISSDNLDNINNCNSVAFGEETSLVDNLEQPDADEILPTNTEPTHQKISKKSAKKSELTPDQFGTRSYRLWSDKEEAALVEWLADPDNYLLWSSRTRKTSPVTPCEVAKIIGEFITERSGQYGGDYSSKRLRGKVRCLELDKESVNKYLQRTGQPLMTLKEAWQLKRKMSEEYPTQSAADADALGPPLPDSARESSDGPLLSVPAENLDEALDFLSRKALQIRVWPPTNLSDGRFPCTAGCPISFRLKITRDIHHLRHRTDGILPATTGQRIVCPECDHQAEDWSALVDHVDAEHHSLSDEQSEKIRRKANEKTKRYRGTDRACKTCKMQFATCAVQSVHALQHREDFGTFDKETEEVQQCPLCTFSTGNVRTLVEHVDNCHARKDLHVCPRCQRSFVTFQRLERHIQQIHLLDDAEKPYECPTCHRKFTGNTYYVHHMRTHHGNTVKCLLCEETFPTTVPLYNHFKQSHSVDGMLLCTLCDKKFPATCKYSFRNFRHHLRRMHRDIGQFPCDICGKVFKQKHGMQKHREFVHKATRDMVCECGKSFFSRRHLLNHKERVHAEGKVDLRKNPGAGEKKQSVRKDYVPPQKMKHYTEFPYQCEECQQGFVRRGMFAYHLTVRHPGRSLDAEPQLALSSTVVQDSLLHC